VTPRAILVGAVLPFLVAAPEARADPSPHVAVALTYTHPEGCPNDAALRNAIANEIGYDPVTPGASHRVEVTITRERGRFVARWEDHDGDTSWVHPPMPDANCRGLMRPLAMSIATRIDPFTPPDASPSPPPAVAAPAAPSAPACPPAPPEPDDALEPLPPPLEVPKPTRPPPEKAPLSFRVGSGVWVDHISDDRGSIGLTLDASVRYYWGSVQIELRGDPALGTTVHTNANESYSVRFDRITGALLACGHMDPLVACLKGQVGAMLFPGSVPSEPAQLYAAAGILLGLEFPVTPSRFILRVDGELLPTIDPASIAPRGLPAFQVAGLNAGLGLRALFALGRR
jgi:hypothetical protein